jgi:hypothetical protein
MGHRTYVYQLVTGQVLVDSIVQGLPPGTPPPTVVSAASTPEVLLNYEEGDRADLDAMMLAAGWQYVATVPHDG